MQAPPVDFHAKDFFQPHVAQVHFATEVIQQGKLAWLVGSFEHYGVKAERLCETIRIGAVEISGIVKQSHSFRALPRFHDQLERARIEPPLSLLDQLSYAIIGKRAVMFLPKLELNIEATLGGHTDDIRSFQIHFRETLAALDARDSDVRAKVEISGKLALRHSDLERAPSSHRRHMVFFCGGDFPARGALIRDHPAGHRNFQNGHQMGALFQVTLESCRIVPRVKRAGSGQYFRDADQPEIIARVMLALCGPLGSCFTHLFLPRGKRYGVAPFLASTM